MATRKTAHTTAHTTANTIAQATVPERVKKTGLVNAAGEIAQSLQDFELTDLQHFTREGVYSNTASKDFHLFYVGRDNVHEILKYVLSRARVSLYLNMFGYDDDELNQIIMQKVMDSSVTVVITLDKSQAGGKHERALLQQDENGSLSKVNSHVVVSKSAFDSDVVIGQSATHQISHTKGFVVDGKVGAEGSTNWSDSGEGTYKGPWQVIGNADQAKNPEGYKAQNNTQSIFTDQDSINRFQTELINEHLIAQKQAAAAGSTTQAHIGLFGPIPPMYTGLTPALFSSSMS